MTKSASDQNSNMPLLRNVFTQYFAHLFYDDAIFMNDLSFWSSECLKIKAEGLRLTIGSFFEFFDSRMFSTK